MFHKNGQPSCQSLREEDAGPILSVKPTRGLLLPSLSATPLGLPPITGQTIRADGEGGAVASDCRALLLRGRDRQRGLTARFVAALHAQRQPSALAQPWRAWLAPRIEHLASGAADGTAAHRRRRSPWASGAGHGPPGASARLG